MGAASNKTGFKLSLYFVAGVDHDSPGLMNSTPFVTTENKRLVEIEVECFTLLLLRVNLNTGIVGKKGNSETKSFNPLQNTQNFSVVLIAVFITIMSIMHNRDLTISNLFKG